MTPASITNRLQPHGDPKQEQASELSDLQMLDQQYGLLFIDQSG